MDTLKFLVVFSLLSSLAFGIILVWTLAAFAYGVVLLAVLPLVMFGLALCLAGIAKADLVF